MNMDSPVRVTPATNTGQPPRASVFDTSAPTRQIIANRRPTGITPVEQARRNGQRQVRVTRNRDLNSMIEESKQMSNSINRPPSNNRRTSIRRNIDAYADQA